MTFRELPSVEWYKLIGHPAMQGAPIPTGAAADNARCVVSEDADGNITSVVWAINLIFMDGFWVAPEHRSGTLGARTFRALRALLDTTTAPEIHCWSTTPEHAVLLERIGFTPLPVLTSVLPLCPQPLPSPPSLPSPPQDSAI